MSGEVGCVNRRLDECWWVLSGICKRAVASNRLTPAKPAPCSSEDGRQCKNNTGKLTPQASEVGIKVLRVEGRDKERIGW